MGVCLNITPAFPFFFICYILLYEMSSMGMQSFWSLIRHEIVRMDLYQLFVLLFTFLHSGNWINFEMPDWMSWFSHLTAAFWHVCTIIGVKLVNACAYLYLWVSFSSSCFFWTLARLAPAVCLNCLEFVFDALFLHILFLSTCWS